MGPYGSIGDGSMHQQQLQSQNLQQPQPLGPQQPAAQQDTIQFTFLTHYSPPDHVSSPQSQQQWAAWKKKIDNRFREAWQQQNMPREPGIARFQAKVKSGILDPTSIQLSFLLPGGVSMAPGDVYDAAQQRFLDHVRQSLMQLTYDSLEFPTGSEATGVDIYGYLTANPN